MPVHPFTIDGPLTAAHAARILRDMARLADEMATAIDANPYGTWTSAATERKMNRLRDGISIIATATHKGTRTFEGVGDDARCRRADGRFKKCR